MIALASGTKDTPVAWAEVAARPDLYFRRDLFPDIRVVEPTRMNSKPMRQWWMRVIELQESDDPEDRFRFTHWWDGSERHEAKYDGEAQEKNPRKAKKDRRLRVVNGPPKGAFEAWTGQPPVAGQADDKSPGSADSDGDSGSEDAEAVGTSGKRKKVAKQSKGKGKEPARAPAKKSARPNKKARTDGDGSSDSARSSDVGSNRAESPPLGSDGDDSPEEVDFENLDSGSEDGAPAPRTAARSREERMAARAKRGEERPHSPSAKSHGTMPAPAPGHSAAGAGPDASLVAMAKGKSPGWVGKNATRLLPFLSALCEDTNYQAALSMWKNAVSCIRYLVSTPHHADTYQAHDSCPIPHGWPGKLGVVGCERLGPPGKCPQQPETFAGRLLLAGGTCSNGKCLSGGGPAMDACNGSHPEGCAHCE